MMSKKKHIETFEFDIYIGGRKIEGVKPMKYPAPLYVLQQELNKAIENEDYLSAAKIRDEIKHIPEL